MDPTKGGIPQKALTSVFYSILACAYAVMKVYYVIRSPEALKEPAHLEESPDTPIASAFLAIALDPRTEVDRLISLASHRDPYVRRAVARNPRLPADEIERLTKDPEPMVADEAKRVLALINESKGAEVGFSAIKH